MTETATRAELSAHKSGVHLAAPDLNPSFTKGLFLGEIREDLVFPYPDVSAEEKESIRLVVDSFRDFAAANVDSKKHDHEARFEPEVLSGIAELGILGLNIPEEYGGFGATAKVTARVFAEVAATDPALAVYLGAHQSIGCKGIVLFGTEEQKQKYLPRCATGELIAAFCLTEPGSGSDAQAMRTRAVPSADGSHYVLNGQKIWISNAGYAGLFTVFAKYPVTVEGKEKERVTAFIVDAKAEGVRLGKLEEKLGIKASDTRAVFFENVVVPASDRLGDVGHGFKIALEILNSGRLNLAAGSARGSRAIMEQALAYAKQREQFGKPIGSFEMIQQKIAAAAADCYAAESAVLATADMVDRGGVDFSLETAHCKIFASELAFRTSNEALQIAGGIGYSKEYPYEQALRDARINMIFEGTNEILRALVALSGLQQPGERLKALGSAFKDPLHSIGAIGSYLAGRARQRLVKPAFTRVHPAMSREADQVAELVHSLATAVEWALRKHGRAIIEREFLHERMANASADLYLSTCVLARITALLERDGTDGDAVRRDLDCARLFLTHAYRRARREIRMLRSNADSVTRAVAEQALESGSLAPEVM